MGDELVPGSWELGRRTGSVMTPEEIAAMTGTGVCYEPRVFIDYDFQDGGRVPPPDRIEVMCAPGEVDGIARTMSRLLESRGWSARVTRRTVSVLPKARGR